MLLLKLNLSLLEIGILQAGALILGFTIYFFYTSRKSLRQAMEASGTTLGKAPKPTGKEPAIAAPRKAAAKPAPIQHAPEPVWQEPLPAMRMAPAQDSLSFHSVSALKESLQQQQQTLSFLLQRVEDLQGDAAEKENFQEENVALQQRIEELELALMRKEQDLKQARQQETIAQQMAARIDEVYREFDVLQQKIASLEGQAGRANALALQLEDLQQSYQQLQKDLVRKQQKLEEVMAENQRLQTGLHLLEDKLAEANTQRQQLMKRTQYLQDANNEMQSVSESHNKLQKELRRIGELESMLNLMAEEKARIMGKQ